ncbi:hypothetical protein [Aquimarina algicola]|uniref:STAS/SEC14 domain-containing protein n=1 Tax=Aquimarina algicola TaxID=2589995 RepID=A0A504JDF5_9FLAO|nr:hypothetical protein [Aquimarina algicola]TPN88744.1 hypothetical protein FHK87_00585 [Aquimarina algicola]
MLKPLTKNHCIKKYDLDICKLFFYTNYLIIEVKEGVCFDHEKAKKISELTKLHFGDSPFGYISHRINSYSINPTDYLKIREVFPYLKAFAVVTYTPIQESNVKFENLFYYGKMMIFNDLNLAEYWVEEQF